MKKMSLFSIAVLTAVIMFAEIPSAEARGCRSSTRVQVGIGNVFAGPTVVRRYAQPVVAAPVFVPPPSYYYNPYTATYAPVYVPAPTYVAAPAYVEEVYVAPRPFGFGGLSFSWNFFK